MRALWAVASPHVWALLALASAFLLGGFVLLSHALTRTKAHGDAWRGWVAHGLLEAMLRLGAACLLAGGALSAAALHAPPAATAGLAGAAVAFLALQAAAVARARRAPRDRGSAPPGPARDREQDPP